MKQHLFYRNVRARDHLELFLVSAVSSLLLLRFYLHITGYPQVGGGMLHIAHMLYGGLLMMAAVVLAIAFLGARIQRLSALLGGIGFGIFIDELGKFITKDNDYFFRPTIGLIYAIFIMMYLLFNFLSRNERLTKREYELNALAQFEEAVLLDLDATEKRGIHRLLMKADKKSPVTQELQLLLERIETVQTPEPNWLRRGLHWADRQYARFWRHRTSRRLVGAVFIAEAAFFVIGVLVTIFTNYTNVTDLFSTGDSYSDILIIGQLGSALVAGGFAIAGAFTLLSSRRDAFELFRRALLINLLLTEFFIFSRIQFGAIPSFMVNLVLLLGIKYALHEERRSTTSA
jgi:hypothetical protein